MDGIVIVIGGTALLAVLIVPVILLWEKAKKSEQMGILTISLVMGYVYAGYKYNSTQPISDILFDVIIATFIVYLGITIIFAVVRTALEIGEKEFEKDKIDYAILAEKYEKGILEQSELKRFSYLHKRAIELKK